MLVRLQSRGPTADDATAHSGVQGSWNDGSYDFAKAVLQRAVTFEAQGVIDVGLDRALVAEAGAPRAALEAHVTGHFDGHAARAFGNR